MKHGLWGALSTLASSGGNVLLVIGVSLTADSLLELAGFGVAQSLLILAFGTSRAAVGEILMVDAVGGRRPAGRRDAVPGTVLLALAAGLLGVLLTPVFGGDSARFLVVVALLSPVILAQDTVRYVLFAEQRHRTAGLMDMAWAAATLVLTATVVAGGGAPMTIVVSWGLLGLATTVVFAPDLARRAIALRAGTRWLTTHRDRSTRLAAEAFAATAIVGLPPAIADLAGQPEVAAVGRVLWACFGLQQIVYAVSLVSIGTTGRSPSSTARVVALAGVATGAVTTMAMVSIPVTWGEQLFADGFAAARDVAIAFGLGQCFVAVANGALVGLRMLGRINETARVRTAGAVLATTAASIGGAWQGPDGYTLGLAGGLAAYGFFLSVLLSRLDRPTGVSEFESEGCSV